MSAPTVPAASTIATGARDPNLRPVAQGAWALYDFANTIFSFAVVSGAIGLYLIDDRSSASATATSLLSIAVVDQRRHQRRSSRRSSGAFSDRGGRRMPFLLFFTALCIGATFFIARRPAARRAGPVHRRELRLPGRAHLLRRDAQDRELRRRRRGRLSGIGTGIGYCGTVFVGLLIFLLDIPVADRFRLTSILFLAVRDPDLLVRARAAPTRRASR